MRVNSSHEQTAHAFSQQCIIVRLLNSLSVQCCQFFKSLLLLVMLHCGHLHMPKPILSLSNFALYVDVFMYGPIVVMCAVVSRWAATDGCRPIFLTTFFY